MIKTMAEAGAIGELAQPGSSLFAIDTCGDGGYKTVLFEGEIGD
jgi:hypothetical protein